MSSGTKEKFQTANSKNEEECEGMQLQNVCIQKSIFYIDQKMWRFKLHYFMLFGGLSFAMPFIPIYARNRIGLSNTALAVILMVQQFSFVFTKPLIGYLADYFKRFKVIMCILIIMQTICFFLILAVPPINLNISYPYSPCSTNMNNGSDFSNCQRMLSNVKAKSSQDLNSSVNCVFIEGHEYQKCFLVSTANISTMSFDNLNTESEGDFLSYQFWLFAFAYNLGMICCSGLFTLSDTACCESVKKFNSEYGRQRLWGAASWGLFAPLAGFINDCTGDYKVSWIVMGICSVLTMLNIAKMDLVKPQFSSDILRNFWTVIKSGEFLVFEIGLICNGIGAGMVWYYLILFLNSIGSSKFLCGLSLTVQCFLGSIPLMFSE